MPILAVVYIPFLYMRKAMCELKEPKWHNPLSPEIKKAVKSRQTLYEEFRSGKYLTVDWLAAIQANHLDKPEILPTHLYMGLWIWKTLFTPI